MSYTPEVDDYVKWNKGKFSVEGWVYFKSNDYITIEIGVKDKDEEDILHCPIHRKTRCLVVCYPQFWKNLSYVKSRTDKYDEK
jgi:hypothetical protein